MDALSVAGQVFNVAFGAEIKINELLAELGTVLGVEVAPEYVAARPGDIPHSLADCCRARDALEYEPQGWPRVCGSPRSTTNARVRREWPRAPGR
jgi:nucleoside-diphosphate-sugar epimerase